MKKAIVLLIGFLLVGLMISPMITRGDTEKEDVYIDPEDFTSDWLFSSKDDEFRIQIDSNIPVDVYVINSGDFNSFSLELSNLSRASLTEKNVTSLDTTWTQPDDRNYHLVIHNHNEEETAIVDYSYTDISDNSENDFDEDWDESEEDVQDAFEIITIWALSVLILNIISVSLIILAIFLLVKKNNKEGRDR